MGMIAALEDKVVDMDTEIKTGNGEMMFFGKYKVKDSKRGGYGTITAAKAFEVSSNVGLVKIINDNYKNNPKQFAKHAQIMMDSCEKFIDFKKIEVIPTSRYRII